MQCDTYVELVLHHLSLAIEQNKRLSIAIDDPQELVTQYFQSSHCWSLPYYLCPFTWLVKWKMLFGNHLFSIVGLGVIMIDLSCPYLGCLWKKKTSFNNLTIPFVIIYLIHGACLIVGPNGDQSEKSTKPGIPLIVIGSWGLHSWVDWTIELTDFFFLNMKPLKLVGHWWRG